VGSNCGQRDFFVSAKRKERRGEVFVSPFSTGSNALLFYLSIPLYQASTAPNESQSGGKFSGVISLKLD